jgi:RNA polymerase sigma factor (sigma-70 family)
LAVSNVFEPNGILRRNQVSDSPATIVTDYLRRVAAPLESRTDAELLALHASERDADAFAILVRRHGPMVLGVCRRALGNSADADDAFQATFLALAKSGRRVNDSVPGWLFRVAVRSSRKALRRHDRPVLKAEQADSEDPFASVEWRDLRRLIDEELDRLPANLQTPLVLCYLEGRTRDEAAQQLGWSLRTLHRRLDEGRKRLRERLSRRGIAPALLAAAVLSANELRAQVPPALLRDADGLADRGSIVPSTIRALVPNMSSWGGLAMKTTVSALIVGGIVLLFGGRQPAGADPVRKDKGTDEPTLLSLAPLKKDKAPDPLAEKVKEAQEKAINYLKARQKENRDGWNWENDTLNLLQPGGTSALALLALLESGLKADDATVARGLIYLRKVKPQHTYVVSLQTQAFCKANQKEDADLIKANVKWLEDSASRKGGQLLGWSYTAAGGNRADNSNTRYAVSGLYAARKAGFKGSNEKLWGEIRDYYVANQGASGGWTYQNESRKDRGTHTMTLSGVLGLIQAKDVLGKDDKDAEKARQLGFEWIAREFTLKTPPHTFYNVDLIAAVGRASERKDLGTKEKKREWYREGAEWLIENQKPGGEWRIPGSALDDFPVVSTSFALRFLASRPED